jgi:hypothetical protein
MTVFALWYGGHGSYADSDPERDVERFDDIDAASAALLSRYFSGATFYQTFTYTNRPVESVLTPGVNGLTYMDVYLALDLDEYDRPLVHQNGPDVRLTLTETEDGPDVHAERF